LEVNATEINNENSINDGHSEIKDSKKKSAIVIENTARHTECNKSELETLLVPESVCHVVTCVIASGIDISNKDSLKLY
jgi:hypothetical protein